jgi:hypothetical protein
MPSFSAPLHSARKDKGMFPVETRGGLLRLLAGMIFSCVSGGCAATPEYFRVAEVEEVAEYPTTNFEVVVSKGEQAANSEYPTALRIDSANAPGFAAPEGKAGTCSGVLIAKNLVLTAAHCMCMQPISSSSSKVLDRADCATRAKVSQYTRKVEHMSDGGMRIVNEFRPTWGTAYLPAEFKVDLNDKGQITTVLADVAVVRLDKEINIKLDHEPADREFRDNDVITLVGFGSISVGGQKEADSPHFGRNRVMGTKRVDYVPRASPDKQDRLGQFYRDYEANTESGDSGGPCFREEGSRRFLMGIMLHKVHASGVKTSCLDLFHAQSLVEQLKKASGKVR